MNIKIKSASVFCLIGDDYDKVYVALRKQLGDGDEQLFTERTPGHEYLQWELSGEGWLPLAQADLLTAQEVRRELLRRQQAVAQRFGTNQAMAQKILTVPDDNYIYYQQTPTGHLMIRLTAWGYRYPERVGGGSAIGDYVNNKETADVVIGVEKDGLPVVGQSFLLNGFSHTTDEQGLFKVGELPIGYQFDVEVEGERKHITVTSGMDKILFAFNTPKPDIDEDEERKKREEEKRRKEEEEKKRQEEERRKAEEEKKRKEREDKERGKGEEGGILADPPRAVVEVFVTLDGIPYDKANVRMEYVGHPSTLICDEQGYATTSDFFITDSNATCTLTIDGESQYRPLTEGVNRFVFSLKRKSVPPPPPASTPWWTYLLEGLMVLGILFLVYITYCICAGMLWS